MRGCRGGVRVPGGLHRLQSGWDGRSPSGGFDSRPPPLLCLQTFAEIRRNESDQDFCLKRFPVVRRRSRSVTLSVTLKMALRATHPRRHAQGPRGKRAVNEATGRLRVAGKASNGQADLYFERTRGVCGWHPGVDRTARSGGRRARRGRSPSRRATATWLRRSMTPSWLGNPMALASRFRSASSFGGGSNTSPGTG